jgi:hypothetical protein
MVQKDEPDDFVLATGEMHSVELFLFCFERHTSIHTATVPFRSANSLRRPSPPLKLYRSSRLWLLSRLALLITCQSGTLQCGSCLQCPTSLSYSPLTPMRTGETMTFFLMKT